jgi:curved DNA-binding protein CbpA
MLQECYHILDLNPGATADEIRRAYRHKAKLYHPDATGSPDDASDFIRLKEAFDILLKNKCREDSWNYRESFHPRDPYFQHGNNHHIYHSHPGEKPGTRERDDPDAFLHTRAGYILTVFMHVLFLATGFVVLLSPLYTLITRGFEGDGSRLYSLFNLVAAMAFGVIMIVKIFGSFLQFVRKHM